MPSFDTEVDELLRTFGVVTQKQVHEIGRRYGLRPIDIAGKMAKRANTSQTRRIRVFLSVEPPRDENMGLAWTRLRETS